MKPALIVAFFAATLLAGIGVGWRLSSARQVESELDSANARTTAITDSVNRQLAQRQADLTREQGRSLALQHDVGEIRLATTTLQLEISHAQFAAPANAEACPDPVGSDEFVRLYNAAAAGGGAAPGAARAGSR